MPVCFIAVGKCPGKPLGGQPVCNLRVVFVYVPIVIEVDELVADRLTEYQPNSQQKQAADGQYLATTPCARRWDREGVISVGRPLLDGAQVVSLGH